MSGEQNPVPDPDKGEVPAPTDRVGAGDRGTGEAPEDTWRGSGPPPRQLPERLADRFELLPEMPGRAGSEAVLMVVKERESGERFVVKVYRAEIELKEETVSRLLGEEPGYQVDHAHVARLYECDQVIYESSAGRHWYELLEYLPGGSLAEMLRKPDRASVEDIFDEVYRAILHLHDLDVVHGDIKPDNILVRTRDPLDLVLADYGLAEVVEGSFRFGAGGFTALYAPPEAAYRVIGRASDLWSLGMIMLEALTGRRPLHEVPAEELRLIISERPVPIPEGIGERWALLLRGLLTRDRHKRWGRDQVEAWLNDESPPEYFDQPVFTEERGVAPFPFAGEEYEAPADLAAAMARNWEESRRQYGRGNILDWVTNDLRDLNLKNYIQDLDESGADLDVRIFRLIHQFNPKLPPTYRGKAITREGLLNLAEAATKDDGVEPAVTLMSLFNNNILGIVDTDWEESTSVGYGDWDQLWRAEITELKRIAQGIQRKGGPSLPSASWSPSLDEEELEDSSSWQHVTDGSHKRQVALIFATLLQVAIEGEERIDTLNQQIQAKLKPESAEVRWFQDLLQADQN